MPSRKGNMTKREIIQVSTEMFLEKGYSNTSVKAVSAQLGISTGNLTFHFPAKEHLLAVLVEMLCDFQWQMMQNVLKEGNTSLLAVCLELTAMAAMCEESEIIRDFYISSYTNPMTLEIIRRNDTQRAKLVFREYRPDWTDAQFTEAETLVSGIEYATLMTTGDSQSLELRVPAALNLMMTLYGIPEDVQRRKLEKVMALDYRGLGKRIMAEFKAYVAQTNEQALEQLIPGKKTGK